MNPNRTPNLSPHRGQAIALPQGAVASVLASNKLIRASCLLRLPGLMLMGGED